VTELSGRGVGLDAVAIRRGLRRHARYKASRNGTAIILVLSCLALLRGALVERGETSTAPLAASRAVTARTCHAGRVGPELRGSSVQLADLAV
jgi:hypothetical protein